MLRLIHETAGDVTRYQFADGSAIVETRGCWDLQHPEFPFMMKCADPDQDTLQSHEEMLEDEGYSAEPGIIDFNFSKDLTAEELLFQRIFDVAIAREPAQDTPASNIREWLEAKSYAQEGLAAAAHALAKKGLYYGQDGQLGGFSVFDENDDGRERNVIWSTHEGLWTDLETMLKLAEQDDEIPDWFEEDWVWVRDADDVWVERCVLRQRQSLGTEVAGGPQ